MPIKLNKRVPWSGYTGRYPHSRSIEKPAVIAVALANGNYKSRFAKNCNSRHRPNGEESPPLKEGTESLI